MKIGDKVKVTYWGEGYSGKTAWVQEYAPQYYDKLSLRLAPVQIHRKSRKVLSCCLL